MRIEDKMEVQNMIEDEIDKILIPLVFIGLLVVSASIGLFVGWLWFG